MHAVIFEVWPKPGRRNDYMMMAAELRELLESIDGFVSVERFESLTESGKLLSLSFFEDEAAIAEWRNKEKHRAAQALGRASYFSDYRLRIAEVVRDYGANDREEAPEDSRARARMDERRKTR